MIMFYQEGRLKRQRHGVEEGETVDEPPEPTSNYLILS